MAFTRRLPSAISLYFFLIAQIIVLIINCFIPIAFWFEEDGSYHTSIARNLNLAAQILMLILVEFQMLRAIRKTEGNLKRRHLAIGVFCIDMIVFIVLQALDPYMPYYSIGCMLGTCLLHTFVLEDEKDARREQLESILPHDMSRLATRSPKAWHAVVCQSPPDAADSPTSCGTAKTASSPT